MKKIQKDYNSFIKEIDNIGLFISLGQPTQFRLLNKMGPDIFLRVFRWSYDSIAIDFIVHRRGQIISEFNSLEDILSLIDKETAQKLIFNLDLFI